MNQNNKIVGIDLGTTKSCVAVWRNEKVEFIPNEFNQTSTPSLVSYVNKGWVVGNLAKAEIQKNSANTVCDVKLLLGRKYNDQCVQNDLLNWKFDLKPGKKDKPMIRIQDQAEVAEYHPEEILAVLLKKLQTDAEIYLGESISRLLVSVPAHFNNAQRQSVKDACAIAGLEAVRIVSEPTLAALAYVAQGKVSDDEEVSAVIFDLGGGTLDVSVVTLELGICEVLATAGDTNIGGEDFDYILVEYFSEQYLQKTGINLKKNPAAIRNLKLRCEIAKRQLSSDLMAMIAFDFLQDSPKIEITITRAQFENLCQPLFEKCIDLVKHALSSAKVPIQLVGEILLVGGSTRIPKIQELLRALFLGKPLNNSIDPDLSVVTGAAIQAALLCNKDIGRLSDILLIDATPHTLGLETSGGKLTAIIPKNTAIPVKKEMNFTTYSDNQPQVSVQIFEGDKEFTKDCNFLGRFNIIGIPPAPKGVPLITVEFLINANSLIQVQAKIDKPVKVEKFYINFEGISLSQEEIVILSQKLKNQTENEAQRNSHKVLQSKLKSILDFLGTILQDETITNQLADVEHQKYKDLHQSISKWLDQTPKFTTDEISVKIKDIETAISTIEELLKHNKQRNQFDFDV